MTRLSLKPSRDMTGALIALGAAGVVTLTGVAYAYGGAWLIHLAARLIERILP